MKQASRGQGEHRALDRTSLPAGGLGHRAGARRLHYGWFAGDRREQAVWQPRHFTPRHRSAGPLDLLIAATAERKGLIMLCDDRDYQTVASVTGQPVKLVTNV
jgi:hypothetical protein